MQNIPDGVHHDLGFKVVRWIVFLLGSEPFTVLTRNLQPILGDILQVNTTYKSTRRPTSTHSICFGLPAVAPDSVPPIVPSLKPHIAPWSVRHVTDHLAGNRTQLWRLPYPPNRSRGHHRSSTARVMMPRTRTGLMSSFSPDISIVPPKRSDEPIGVTTTRASVRIEQILRSCRGSGCVRLHLH